jgi:hypothetical protein
MGKWAVVSVEEENILVQVSPGNVGDVGCASSLETQSALVEFAWFVGREIFLSEEVHEVSVLLSA